MSSTYAAVSQSVLIGFVRPACQRKRLVKGKISKMTKQMMLMNTMQIRDSWNIKAVYYRIYSLIMLYGSAKQLKYLLGNSIWI